MFDCKKDKDMYKMFTHCWNCGKSSDITIKKGILVEGYRTKCPNCGCVIVLHDKPRGERE